MNISWILLIFCCTYQVYESHRSICFQLLMRQSFFFLSNRGEHDYELWLRFDLYTNKHTQWYYFMVQNARPGVYYRFTIMNFMKVRLGKTSPYHGNDQCLSQNFYGIKWSERKMVVLCLNAMSGETVEFFTVLLGYKMFRVLRQDAL